MSIGLLRFCTLRFRTQTNHVEQKYLRRRLFEVTLTARVSRAILGSLLATYTYFTHQLFPSASQLRLQVFVGGDRRGDLKSQLRNWEQPEALVPTCTVSRFSTPEGWFAPNASDGGVVPVWLPKGTWYDFWNDTKYSGDRVINYNASIGNLPLFVKAGSIYREDARTRVVQASIGSPLRRGKKIQMKTVRDPVRSLTLG